MKMWVMHSEFVSSDGEVYTDIQLFSSYESAKKAFDKSVTFDKMDVYEDYYNIPDSGYKWIESDCSWKIWEDGSYCYTHSAISIFEKEVQE